MTKFEFKMFHSLFFTVECSCGYSELMKTNVSKIVRICTVRVNEFWLSNTIFCCVMNHRAAITHSSLWYVFVNLFTFLAWLALEFCFLKTYLYYRIFTNCHHWPSVVVLYIWACIKFLMDWVWNFGFQRHTLYYLMYNHPCTSCWLCLH
jgi:hypothetical protein